MAEKSKGCPFHSTKDIKELDALNPEARANPWPYYDWLRESNDKVYKLPYEKDFYLVHHFEDVKKAFADSKALKSKILPTKKGLFLALMDDEEHRRIRSAIATVFLPKNIQKREPRVKKIVEDATRELINKKEADLLESWAVPIPLKVLASMFEMEVNDSSVKKLYLDTLAINKAIFVTGGTGPRRKNEPTVKEKFLITLSIIKNVPLFIRLWRYIGFRGYKELGQMFKPEKVMDLTVPRPNFEHIPDALAPLLRLMLFFAKKFKTTDFEKDHEDDVIPVLSHYIKEGQVTLTETMMLGAFILFAGHETATSLLSNCFVHLANHPAEYKELQDNPEKIDNFIEEVLRYYTPIGRFLRRAAADYQVEGEVIPKDSIVMMMVGAANTDPAKFDDACRFDMNRNNANQHISFGKGPHFCIGAGLARMQARLAVTELLNLSSSIRINESKPSKLVVDRDNGVYRYEQLEVVVERT